MVPGVAVRPRAPRSLHLIDVTLPALGPDDVLVRVKEVGYCGTDREIIEGHFGSAPEGFESLVIGHETLGVVEAVGSNVSTLHHGDLVTATARRPCDCPQCLGGEPDFCSAFGYRERGIIGLHGYLTERFVEHEEHLVKVPKAIAHLGVLTEPTSVAEKAWRVAQAVQSRLTTWRPEAAFVIGAGPIGVLTTLVLRANGLAVSTLDLKPTPNAAESVVSNAGADYVCTQNLTTDDLKAALARPDVIVECTGSSSAVFMAMELLANNGVLVSLSVTGGNRELTIPADKLNLEFVLGNKVWVGSVNSSLTDFASAVHDLQRFETLWPGLTGSMITRRLSGLESALDLPEAGLGSLKTVIEV
jgi:threonine dehydrogenase-like Zn-dependent dehydrogenase